MTEGEKTITRKGRRRSLTGEDVGPVEIVVGSAEVASNASMEECPPPGLMKENLCPSKLVTTSVKKDSRIQKTLDKEREQSEG